MIRDSNPFSVPSQELEDAFSRAAQFVAREYLNPTERPILPAVPRALFDTIIPNELPLKGLSLATVGSQAENFLAHYTARLLSPGFSAMVTTSPNPYAILADILACAVNQHIARGDVGEFGARLEERVVHWIGDFIGYPAASGSLTSGGSSANLVALAAARSAVRGRDIRWNGLTGPPLVAYASTETHGSTDRALELLGIGLENFRRIPVDDRFRLDVNALAQAIVTDRAAGREPFAVIAQGGSAGTGAVDPLDAIASLCERASLWMHVDAAYGGPAATVAPADRQFAGLSRADSVTVDPHKWLYVNYDCGCVLLKDAERHRLALGGEPLAYLQADTPTDAPDFMGRGIDMSRGLRALKVWATFAGLGAEKIRSAIAQDMMLAARFAELVTGHSQFELYAPPSLSIALFRFVPEPGLDAAYLNTLNGKIPAALRADGRIYLGPLRIADAALLRICLINSRVTDTDLETWLEIIAEVGGKLRAML